MAGAARWHTLVTVDKGALRGFAAGSRMASRVEGMWEAFHRRPAVFLLAMVLLLAILAVVISPAVDLPNCAMRGKKVAVVFQWLLTMALILTAVVLPSRFFFLSFLEWAGAKAPPPLRLCDPDLTCARLR